MNRVWEADPLAGFKRRLGRSAQALGKSENEDDCPDIWELDNGDIAVIGRDLTTAYESRLPVGVRIAHDERLVVIPGIILAAAKPDIGDV